MFLACECLLHFGEKEDIDKLMNVIKTPLDAIKKGLEDEKSSIFFYNELKGLYKPGSTELSTLDKIISEERGHILKLSNIYTKITNL